MEIIITFILHIHPRDAMLFKRVTGSNVLLKSITGSCWLDDNCSEEKLAEITKQLNFLVYHPTTSQMVASINSQKQQNYETLTANCENNYVILPLMRQCDVL